MVTLKATGIKEIQAKFANFHMENAKALSFAMNKAHSVAQTASLLASRKRWNIKTGVYKKLTYVKKANVNKSRLEFGIISKPINLVHFSAKPLKRGGVSYKIEKGKSKKLGGAFIGGAGQGFVLKRTTPDRYPLMPHFAISPSWMFHQAKAEDVYIKTFLEGKDGSQGFNKIYLAQLKRLLKK